MKGMIPMKTKTFPNGLVVKHRKSAIIFEAAEGVPTTHGTPKTDERRTYWFGQEGLAAFVDYIEEIANEAWSNITPKEAQSPGADYWEYYDREYDNNGYLAIATMGIRIDPPHGSTGKLYQFNKAKIQSFIYDCRKN